MQAEEDDAQGKRCENARNLERGRSLSCGRHGAAKYGAICFGDTTRSAKVETDSARSILDRKSLF
jgi:hypothetical protein